MNVLTSVVRNISRRKARTLLIIVALSLVMTMIVSIPPSITAGQQATQKTIDNLASNAEFIGSRIHVAATEIDCQLPIEFKTNEEGETTLERPLMDCTDYGNLTAIPNVAHVAPILVQLGDIDSIDDNWSYQIQGVPIDDANLLNNCPIILPTNITSGRNMQASDRSVVVLHERIANHYNVVVGGTLTIFGRNFNVIGIQGQEALNSTYATMSLSDAQVITNKTGQASMFKVFADDVNNVHAVSQNIIGAYPKLDTTIAQTLINQVNQMQHQIEEQLSQAESTMVQIQNTGTVEMVIITVAGGAVVLFIMLEPVFNKFLTISMSILLRLAT